MRKLLLVFALGMLGHLAVKAQTTYRAALGLGVDLYDDFHKEFFRAKGLRWYAGVGPSIIFLKNSDNIFALRPHLGLDFKVDGVPFVINFDWRPSVVLSDVGDNEVGAFGFGLQFAIN